MSELNTKQRAQLQPRVDIDIRIAEPDGRDLKFIDGLQKQHAKALGFMQRKALEGYIASGDVLIAEGIDHGGHGEGRNGFEGRSTRDSYAHSKSSSVNPVNSVVNTPLGYCIGRDRYFKREDVGIIYQLVVGPAKRRSLVGAALVQAMFERAAYGCRLFCCWCAQDLDANRFWEAIGFVPLAFRTGSSTPGKERIHIFWQKRIRESDHETPYWFPSMTGGGAIREDRLVIPIPPGTHWSEAKPLVLPGVERFVANEPHTSVRDADHSLPHPDGRDGSSEKRMRHRRRTRRKTDPSNIAAGGLRFPGADDASDGSKKNGRSTADEKKRRGRTKRKYHPEYVAAARELAARYLEQVHRDPGLLHEAGSGCKYDVSRQLDGQSMDDGPIDIRQVTRENLLDAA